MEADVFGPSLGRVWMSRSKVKVTRDKTWKTAASSPLTIHCKACAVRCKWRAADGTIPWPRGLRGDGSARWRELSAACVRCMFGSIYSSSFCWFTSSWSSSQRQEQHRNGADERVVRSCCRLWCASQTTIPCRQCFDISCAWKHHWTGINASFVVSQFSRYTMH